MYGGTKVFVLVNLLNLLIVYGHWCGGLIVPFFWNITSLVLVELTIRELSSHHVVTLSNRVCSSELCVEIGIPI